MASSILALPITITLALALSLTLALALEEEAVTVGGEENGFRSYSTLGFLR